MDRYSIQSTHYGVHVCAIPALPPTIQFTMPSVVDLLFTVRIKVLSQQPRLSALAL